MAKKTLGLRTIGIAAASLFCATAAQALTCGTYNGFNCTNATQYAGGFAPGVGYGGFGGGSCTATKTPVIFIHGNGDNAMSFDATPGQVTGYSAPPRSIYQELKAQGYNDCELFGVTYLSDTERNTLMSSQNYHQPTKYNIITAFIDKVKAYTGKTQVDIVTHSLGVSMTLAALKVNSKWSSVRKFVNVAGGLKGLNSCYYTGYANAASPTCGSQNVYNSNIFGFFPQGWYWGVYVTNTWTGSGSSNSLRAAPSYRTAVSFYTISSGNKDEVACSTNTYYSTCDQTSKFDTASNVKAQINIGAGTAAGQVDWDWSDYSYTALMGGDSSGGVGHFRSLHNSGTIINRMLQTTCTGLDCAANYTYGPKALY